MKIEEKVKKAFEQETPDCRQRVLWECEREIQYPAPPEQKEEKPAKAGYWVVIKRLLAACACLAIFVCGLLVGKILPSSSPALPAEQTHVYLDVNPSVELVLDEKDYVLSCTAVNEDAESILQGMNLKGVEMKTALNAVVGAMYVNGYLAADENSILISVDCADEQKTDVLIADYTTQVNEIFSNSQINCSIIAQSVKADEALSRRAEENGVSVGKMHLVDKMVGGMDEFTEDDAADLSKMSIKELHMIYSHKPEKGEPDEDKKDEVISGDVGGYVTVAEAVRVTLEDIGVSAEEAETKGVLVLPARQDNAFIMVYCITVQVKADGKVYVYQINCQNGEIVQSETVGETPNEPEHGGQNGGQPEHGQPDEDDEPEHGGHGGVPIQP